MQHFATLLLQSINLKWYITYVLNMLKFKDHNILQCSSVKASLYWNTVPWSNYIALKMRFSTRTVKLCSSESMKMLTFVFLSYLSRTICFVYLVVTSPTIRNSSKTYDLQDRCHLHAATRWWQNFHHKLRISSGCIL